MDQELKQAYETLGLPEDATREQVEQRYFVLLKKAKSGSIDLDGVNKAYNRILGFESEKDGPAEKQGKAAYFFYYYKVHVLVALVVLLVAGFTIKGIVDRRIEEANKPPLDLSVTVFGNYFGTEGERLSQNLLARIPEWKRIDVLVSYVPPEIASQQDMALQQKGMLTIMTEKMDLMVVDAKNFEMLASQEAFLPLDSLPIWSELDKDKVLEAEVGDENEKTVKPFGIDVTGNPVFAETLIDAGGEKQILTVRANSANLEKAQLLMRKILAAG